MRTRWHSSYISPQQDEKENIQKYIYKQARESYPQEFSCTLACSTYPPLNVKWWITLFTILTMFLRKLCSTTPALPTILIHCIKSLEINRRQNKKKKISMSLYNSYSKKPYCNLQLSTNNESNDIPRKSMDNNAKLGLKTQMNEGCRLEEGWN